MCTQRAQLHTQRVDLLPCCICWSVPLALAHCFSNPLGICAQDGKHYEVLDPRSVPWTIRILALISKDLYDKTKDGEDGMGQVEPALQLSLSYRLAEHVYYVGMKPREQCVKVECGEVGPWGFMSWCCQMLADTELRNSLFFIQNWPQMKSGQEAIELDFTPGVTTSSLKYQFDVVNNCICMHRRVKGEEEPVRERLASFFVKKVISSYKFFEAPDQPTYIKFLVRREVNPDGEGTIYFAINDLEERHKCVHRAPHAQFLEMEIMFSLTGINTQTQLAAFFQNQNPCLQLNMTVDQWMCYMSSLESPLPKDVISYFGKQTNGIFVAGNCAYEKGMFLTHEVANVAIIPQYFSKSLLPIHIEEYPRHMIIPIPQVRYVIGSILWNHVMPQFFGNNYKAATAVFCMAVMGMYADRLWEGHHGVGHGMPITWVYSTEPNTGKTEATLLANSMLGFFKSAPWAGDATKPALFERLAQQSCLPLMIDDVVAKKNESQALAQLIRAVFDKCPRTVCGKSRTPKSPVIFTSNSKINADDQAQQSRCITIRFQKLQTNASSDVQLYNHWMALRELVSALAPDFANLLFEDGTMDNDAITDCANFMQIAVNKERDRNANLWGMLLYFMLLIHVMFQASSERLQDVVHWTVNEALRQSHIHHQASSMLELFLIEVSKLRADKGSEGVCDPLGPLDRTIYWDKLRTNIRPVLSGSSASYIALRVEPCVKVIELIRNKKMFDVAEIYSLAQQSDFAIIGDGAFYDVGKGPWPIARLDVDSNNQPVRIPCAETDAGLAEYMSNMHAIFFLRRRFDEITKGSTPHANQDHQESYKNIIVCSSNTNENYNFFQTVTGIGTEGWYGFRVLQTGDFGFFCGLKNTMFIGSARTDLSINEAVEARSIADGHGRVAELYEPSSLKRWFGYEMAPKIKLPYAFTHNAFHFENGEDHETPPEPYEMLDAYLNSTPSSPVEDDEHSQDGNEPDSEGDISGSNPDSDATTKDSESESEDSEDSPRPVKRSKGAKKALASRFVHDEAEDEGEEGVTEVC